MIVFYRSFGVFIRLIEILVLVRILFSIINIGFNSLIGNLVYEVTEPILSISRELINKLGIDTGMIDFSPMVSIILLHLLYYIVGKVIFL